MGKTYYWLRLQKDFFKRHDIRIIEAMPNGKDYILFYLKLLVESIDHEGELRFSDTIPYNEEMLATVTNTNIDIVRVAMQVFKRLEMIEVLEDKTIYMSEVEKMIGTAKQDDHTRESARLRKQKQREREKAEKLLCDSHVTCHGELEKEIEIEIEKESKSKYGAYAHVLLSDKEFSTLKDEYGQATTEAAIKNLDEYIEMTGKKYKSHYMALRKWGIASVKEKSKGFDERTYNMDELEERLLEHAQNSL